MEDTQPASLRLQQLRLYVDSNLHDRYLAPILVLLVAAVADLVGAGLAGGAVGWPGAGGDCGVHQRLSPVSPSSTGPAR